MSSSYFESLGRATGAPPDISKTNYLQTTVDMSKAVNENIDETQKSLDAHFDQLIEIYNHEHEKAMKRPDKVQKFLDQGIKTYDNVSAFADYYTNDYAPFAKNAAKYRQRFNDDPESIIKGGKNWMNFDREVRAENELENNRNVLRKESNKLGNEAIREGNPQVGDEILSGPKGEGEEIGGYRADLERHKDLNSLTKHYPAWLTAAFGGMKVHIGNYHPDGTAKFQTYDETGDLDEKEKIAQIVNAWYAYNHRDLARNRFGLYKRDFINHMVEQDQSRKKTLLEDTTNAIVENNLNSALEEIDARMSEDPGFGITWIQMNSPNYADANGIEDYRRTREVFYKRLIWGLKNDVFENPSKVINNFLAHEFEAHDHTPEKPHIVTPESYWKKDSKLLRTALNDALKKTADDADKEVKAEKNAAIGSIKKEYETAKETWTYQKLRSVINQFKQEFNITDDEDLPAYLKHLSYLGEKDDDEIISRLQTRLDTTGVGPTLEEVASITSTEKKKEWQAKMGMSLRREGKGPGTVSERENSLKGFVSQHTSETVEPGAVGSTAYRNNLVNGRIAYNNAYNLVKSQGGSDMAAHKAGNDAIEAGLKKPNKDNTGYAWDTLSSDFNIPETKQDNALRLSLVKNRTLLESETPLKGEERHLEAALKAFQNKKNKKIYNIPQFYNAAAAKLGTNGHDLAKKRLVATGMMKENEIEFPEDRLDSTTRQNLVVKPSAAKTYKVTQENPDYTWMLDTVQSLDATQNGGYLAVKDINGKYTNIETVTGKPIAEITIGDIYGLALDGYSNFGMYDLTAQGIVDLIESGAVPLNESWDVKDQDLLILARLRQKAQNAQKYSGTNPTYRRLVNISKEDKERFKEIAGDLPVWLQLDNLLPEVAKELIKQTTQ